MEDLAFPLLAWSLLLGAALLEVGGDAMIRKGLRSGSWALIIIGGLTLAGYGLLVNLVKWDFSKLLGVYVAVFALVSIVFGRVVFREDVPLSTWMGLALILLGGVIIQLGHR